MRNNLHNVLAPTVTREQALEIAERAAEILKTRFGATRVIVFGSARGHAPWHEGSDLDLAVEGIKPKEFFSAWAALERELTPYIEIDLVDIQTAKPRLRARILEEIEMATDPLQQLSNLIQDELELISEVVARIERLVAQLQTDVPNDDQLDAMALKLQQFYSGVESIFERIAVQFDGQIPKTEQWHTDLLMQMTRANPDKRPAVISPDLAERLRDNLAFRHLVVHAYSVEFIPTMVLEKGKRVPETFALLRAQLDAFFTALEQMKSNAQ